ncbi:hypothetical protein DFP72DRAFT_900922 [Ephemerocybe angulata]|uniref:F-box domain-containing protein n=1 Tax=Ephemerocybe angulata TaxID=980116 RepID=A0A8H6M6Y7_9AGAR|nr:hypothetical protein DFP72DRAFT_900922 [Tulosesus angulatus]
MSDPSPQPIHDLNDDVLLYIFIHLVDKSYPSFKDALSISQVCSRWRTIATENCPDIWKAHALRVPKSSKERAAMLKDAKMSTFNQEMVRRSHNLPLQFGWDEIMPGTAGVIAMLEFHNQIGSLSLACPTDWPRGEADQDPFSVAMRRTRMPRLRHLELSSFPPLSLPTPLFTGDLSSLTSLILQPGNLLNLKGLKIGKNLRVLRLSGLRYPPEAVATLFADHVDFLERTPLLTTLELEFERETWGRSPGAGISNQVTVVTLPHLTSIELCISFTDFELFLDRVRAPACLKIRLKIVTDHIDAVDRIHPRIAQLVAAYGSGAPPEGYRLHISSHTCILSPGGTPDMGETLLGTSYKIYLQMYDSYVESPLQPWLTIAERITSLSGLITLDDAEKEMIKKLTALELLICPEQSVHEIVGEVELVDGKWVSVERPDLRIETMNRTSPFDSQRS